MSCSCDEKNIFLPMAAEVVSARAMTESEKHFELRLKSGEELDFAPGQIVEAGVMGYGEIPLGLSSSPTKEGAFELVVREVGKVSKALCALSKGDQMTIRGPLGKGFPVEELQGSDVLIVAGGIGLCPTRSLIRYILDKPDDFGKFTLFFGARTPKDQLFKEELGEWRDSDKVDYYETVDQADDSWKGNVGVITELFKNVKISPETKVIICGPPVMYKFVVRELDKLEIPRTSVFVDLERRMKCGVGKCGHCQINDKYVCIDGPVFRFSDIEHLEEAI